MKNDNQAEQLLNQLGVSAQTVELYQECRRTGDVLGQKRVLSLCYRLQAAALKQKRRQLACLDYLVTQLEGKR